MVLVLQVAKILGDLGDSLDWQHLETDLSKLHEEHVVHARYLLSLLEHASLQKLYAELEFGTSYRHETLRFVVLATFHLKCTSVGKTVQSYQTVPVVLGTGTSFWRCCPLLGHMTPYCWCETSW